MSQVDREPDYEQPPQQPVGINFMFVMGMLAAALIAFSFAVVATYVVMKDRRATLSPNWPLVPHVLGQPSINEVNQVPFRLDTRAYQMRDEQDRRLETYGWVDRQRGLVHIPVGRAMDELAGGGTPAEEAK